MFFAVVNLTELATSPCEPWNFKPVEGISEQVRHSKHDRQVWYKTKSTVHNFYTGLEGANPNQRVSKSNPPRRINAIVADYDLPVSPQQVSDAMKKFKLLPSYAERSLGGNLRLIWLLKRPILTDSYDFAVFVLQQVSEWLKLEILPGLDIPALTDPTRLYCNGCQWELTGAEGISENTVQGFFVRCGAEFIFKDSGSGAKIPLDIVEKQITKQFPNFVWPGPFEVGSQGPSFWIPESTSAQSAILKEDGFFTFSAHAERPFYSWSDIFGPDFAKDFQTNCVAEATKDVYHDGKLYWLLNPTEQRFVAMAKETLTNHLKVNCRISSKPDKSGTSLMERCLAHIHQFGVVEGGAPILFQPPGLIHYSGLKIINTTPKSKIVVPSGVPAAWGPLGNFPFLSGLLDGIFEPVSQLEYFLAWLKHFYVSALAQTPKPGQNIFLSGGPGVGKTLLNREIVGGLLGGHSDAARFVLGEAAFNSSLFQSAVWSVDDETISDSDSAHRKFSSYIKLCAANQDFEYRKKFEHNLTVPWTGRIICTLNLDESSSRSLPSLDESTEAKISFFRCAKSSKIIFPDREVIKRLIKSELPNLAQWLTEWTIPARLIGESRYGVLSHHETSLMDKAHQGGKSAPFKEILLDFLTRYFADNKDASEWRGSVTQLMRFLLADPLNDTIMRQMRLEQVNRYLESLSREGVITCSVVNGQRKTRLWVFPRFEKGE